MKTLVDYDNPWALYPPRSPLLSLLPMELIDRYHVLPLALEAGELLLASRRPLGALLKIELRAFTGYRLYEEVVEDVVWERLYRAFHESLRLLVSPSEATATLGSTAIVSGETSGEVVVTEEEVPRLADAILIGAWQRRASDIHLEPDRLGLLVRLRIDGLLQEYMRIPEELAQALIARLKLLAEMDLMERRAVQDGHLYAQIQGLELNLRVSSLPVVRGEKLVLRFLRREQVELSLHELGMAPDLIRSFNALLSRPHGLLLVAGPTGSGKTTTLYTAMHQIRDPSRNITTIEDPVEYELDGMNQITVQSRGSMTFAAGLRGILRQDPDIIMVGEIRDRETAEIALSAAITGRLVLSSIHTGDACGAILRLLDMGLEPYLIASALVGVVSQRLLRRVCPECGQMTHVANKTWLELGLKIDELPSHESMMRASPGGCPNCHGSGYLGRVGIFEILAINDIMQRLIMERAEEKRLHQAALEADWIPMLCDGWRQCRAGVTDIAELRRVLCLKEDYYG